MPGSTFMLVASGSGKALPFQFDVRVCYPNAESKRDLTTKQIYHQRESEKKRMYASRVLEVEQGSFTPLVFTTTGEMADECKRYHSRLAELSSTKKGEDYSTTMYAPTRGFREQGNRSIYFKGTGDIVNFFQGTGELLIRLLGTREHQSTFNNNGFKRVHV